MQPFCLTKYIKPNDWRKNTSASKSKETTDKTETPEQEQPVIEETKESIFYIVKKKLNGA